MVTVGFRLQRSLEYHRKHKEGRVQAKLISMIIPSMIWVPIALMFTTTWPHIQYRLLISTFYWPLISTCNSIETLWSLHTLLLWWGGGNNLKDIYDIGAASSFTTPYSYCTLLWSPIWKILVYRYAVQYHLDLETNFIKLPLKFRSSNPISQSQWKQLLSMIRVYWAWIKTKV